MSHPNMFADGAASASGQGSLFDGGKLDVAQPQASLPNPANIRRRLHAVLAKARAAASIPWPPRDARMWQAVFPQMANWLPPSEADHLRVEFARALDRLQPAS